jgi:phage portal protein BeeE
MPWLKRFEGEFRKLLTPEERKTYFAEFNVDALLRADIDKRMDAYLKAIQARVYSPNEARDFENLPPYSGGDAFENPHTSSPFASPAPAEPA